MVKKPGCGKNLSNGEVWYLAHEEDKDPAYNDFRGAKFQKRTAIRCGNGCRLCKECMIRLGHIW